MAVEPALPQSAVTEQADERVDPAATEALLARVRERVDELRSQRFAGRDPLVEPKRVRRVAEALVEGAVAALAAERLGALLRFGESLVAPSEDLAREELADAYRSLAVWDLRAAASALERASRYARFPEHQQRIALGWSLHRLLGDLLRQDPARDKTPERPVLELLPTLDHLPLGERSFYRDEARRLADNWRWAASEEEQWCAWALLRLRVALLRGEGEETALAWLLRLVQRAGLEEDFAGTAEGEQFARLVQQARAFFLSLAASPPSQAVSEPVEKPSPYELFRAVVAVLTLRWGEDALARTHRFTLALWVPESPQSG